MRVVVVAALLILGSTVHTGQRLPASGGIAMRQFEACRVRPTVEAMGVELRGGRVAVYEVTADAAGKPVAVERTNGDPQILRLVQIDTFEPCVMRWLFAEPGTYTVTLTGAMTGIFQIDIAHEAKTLRITIPEFIPR